MNVCPECSGSGQSGPAFVRYSDRPCEVKAMDCPVCRGTGEVDDGYAERRRIGKEWREWRMGKLLSQRELGREAGVDYAKLSQFEFGRDVLTDDELSKLRLYRGGL